MKMTRTRIAIAVSGVATLVAMLVDPGNSTPSQAVAAVEGARPASDRPARSGRDELALPRRSSLGRQRGDPFSTRSWAPPPPPPPPRAPVQVAAAPVPPPNPYRFAGTSRYDGKLHTFLTDGQRVYEVDEGGELNGGYRVDAVTPEEIVLVYKPLGSRQPIAAKSAFPTPPPQRVAEVPGAIPERLAR
jgi:hypothetical protein